MHTIADDEFPFCESVAQLHEQIIIAAMVKEGESIGWFVKPGVPVPNESALAMKVVQTEIVTSIIKQNESYLGKVSYIHVRQELADIILFPLRDRVVFCIVLQRPYDLDVNNFYSIRVSQGAFICLKCTELLCIYLMIYRTHFIEV